MGERSSGHRKQLSNASREPLNAYDPRQSYRWNFEQAPPYLDRPKSRSGVQGDESNIEGIPSVIAEDAKDAMNSSHASWDFLGLPTMSPFGIAAGPLLNGAWCLHYAELGFDVVTYKTVRSVARECYEMPNLVPVACSKMTGNERSVTISEEMLGTWAVSFGMPSSSPEEWRRDVEATRNALDDRKCLAVSVVGTQQDGWGLQELASDYAQCAKWAVQSGADVIEANFSCPNVSTCDGQLYQDAYMSRLVASVIREAVGNVPLVIKIGFVPDPNQVQELVANLEGLVDGLSMTNSLASRVVTQQGEKLFLGEQRGICGEAIRDPSLQQVSTFQRVIERVGSQIKLIGVGGISAPEHVQAYLDAGASFCHLATAIMTDPEIGLRLAQVEYRRTK